MDVDALSLKELKALITEAGLSAADCIDKSDLRTRAKEAQSVLADKPAPAPALAPEPSPTATSTTSTTKTFGGYECIVKGASDLLDGSGPPADLLIVCLHGLGATNADLAPVPDMLGGLEPAVAAARTLCVFPQAPMLAAVGSTAWWEFNVMGYMQALMTRDQDQMAKLIREKPAGLDGCRVAMATLLEQARGLAAGAAGAPFPNAKLLLMGFSLGAITALDLALAQPADATVAGLVFMSGAPIVVDDWATSIKARPALRVHMTAGSADMTLPEQASGWVRDLLTTNGVTPEYKVHSGGHDLGGPEVLAGIARFVRESLGRA